MKLQQIGQLAVLTTVFSSLVSPAFANLNDVKLLPQKCELTNNVKQMTIVSDVDARRATLYNGDQELLSFATNTSPTHTQKGRKVQITPAHLKDFTRNPEGWQKNGQTVAFDRNRKGFPLNTFYMFIANGEAIHDVPGGGLTMLNEGQNARTAGGTRVTDTVAALLSPCLNEAAKGPGLVYISK